MNYQEGIDWLFSTQLFGIKLGLDGPRNLLKEFLAFPKYGVKVAHIAGTNGKGSTCAIMDGVARACGVRTALFTSPHLIDFRERMTVSGTQISEEVCAEILTEVRTVCERLETHPTFFEITLAVALRWFRQCDAELIILETGMGGRLDATTAVPADVCVVTPIGMDHAQWLGDTLEKIAREKAGIFLKGIPAVSAPQAAEAKHVLDTEANARQSPLEYITEPLLGYGINLEGEHQKWNAALALGALYKLGIHLGYESVSVGLGTVKWPGRFERFKIGGVEVILDGAHNVQAAEMLKKTWISAKNENVGILIFGAVESKAVGEILEALAGVGQRVILCKVATERGLSTGAMAAALPDDREKSSECYETFAAAFAAAKAHGGPILVTGSLFLVGEARAQLIDGDFQKSFQ